MKKRLGRRIALFGQTIAVVWLLAVVAWLQKLDSLDLRGDVQDLKLLAEVGRIEPAEKLQRLPDRTFDNTIEWVTREHPEIAQGRADVRRRVVDLLLKRGVQESLVGNFSGKMLASAQPTIPFHFLRVLDLPPSASSEDLLDDQTSQRVGAEVRIDSAGRQASRHDQPRLLLTVSHVLDELEELARPREMVCAIDVDDVDLEEMNFDPPIRDNGTGNGYVIRPKHVEVPPTDPDERTEASTPPTTPPSVVIEFGGPDESGSLGPGLDANGNPDLRVETDRAELPFAQMPQWRSLDDVSQPNPPHTDPHFTTTSSRPEIPGMEMLREEQTSATEADTDPIEDWRDYGETRSRRQHDWLFVDRAELQDDEICIDYLWAEDEQGNIYDMDQDMDRGTDYGRRRELFATAPVRTARFIGPSLLEVSDPARSANGPLLKLSDSPDRVAYLRRAYGHLPLDHASSLASEGLAQAYRSLSLFGFQFSTRRFPVAVLLCMIVALWQTLAALVVARRRQLPVLEQIADESAVEMLVSSRTLRVLLWVVLPLSAVWAALPLVPLSSHELTWLTIGSVVLACLGVACAFAAEQGDATSVGSDAPGSVVPSR